MSGQAVMHIDSFRGDHMEIHESAKGNVVETFMSGNTTIHICDDFIVADRKVETVVKEFYEIGWKILTQSKVKPL